MAKKKYADMTPVEQYQRRFSIILGVMVGTILFPFMAFVVWAIMTGPV